MEELKVKRILVAVKFSRRCVCAVRFALGLTKALDGHMVAVHVVDKSTTAHSSPEGSQDQNDAVKRFSEEYGPILDGFENVSFECLKGNPTGEIYRAAQRHRVDIIVLGCHQRPKARTVTRLGLVGLEILETAPCPILLVPCFDVKC